MTNQLILVGMLFLGACGGSALPADGMCEATTYEAGAQHLCDELGEANPIVVVCSDASAAPAEREAAVGSSNMADERAASLPGVYCYPGR